MHPEVERIDALLQEQLDGVINKDGDAEDLVKFMTQMASALVCTAAKIIVIMLEAAGRDPRLPILKDMFIRGAFNAYDRACKVSEPSKQD